MVAIVSAEHSKFGKRDEDIFDIAAESSIPIVRKYSRDIDFVVVSNCYSGEFNDVSGLNDLLTTYLSLDGIPSIRVDNTSASGGASLFAARSLIESGAAKRVLVIGVEKMSEKPTKEVARIITSLLGRHERAAGPSLPSLAGLLARMYMEKYPVPRESIARVSVKNHENGAKNQIAQIRKPVTVDQVLESRIIVDPLRLYEFSPVTDGSASLLLVGDDEADSYTSRPVYVKGIGFGSDSTYVTDREDLLKLEAVKTAGISAMKSAGIERPDFAELHDMATILEIVESEALGFFGEGEGWKAVDEGITEINGEFPINSSGGLMSRGHPIGASGISQIYEAFLQITGKAGERQIRNASTGFTVGMAGFGNSAVATVVGDSL